jgi:catechol 2,3-dioxygenase-like lactoylglutathione lyase family enzyme
MEDMRVREVLETCLYAHDLDAAESFYRSVLGLELIGRVEGRHVFFRCGHRVFLVFNPARTREPGGELPPHGGSEEAHVAFAVPGDEIGAWRAHLERKGVQVESDVSWPRGGRSVYFRDPAGNSVELATPRIWAIPEEAAFGIPQSPEGEAAD